MPESFPGTVMLVCEKGGQITNLQYRKYDNADNEEYYHFVTRILSAVNPIVNNFRGRKERELLSDIFSVSDEAYALMIIYNEYHVWENHMKRKDDPNIQKRPKRFCDPSSGSKDGWTLEGRNLFRRLCREVEKLRGAPDTGEQFEQKMRERFRGENPLDNSSSTSNSGRNEEVEIEEEEFVDPTIKEKYEAIAGIRSGGGNGEEATIEEEQIGIAEV